MRPIHIPQLGGGSKPKRLGKKQQCEEDEGCRTENSEKEKNTTTTSIARTPALRADSREGQYAGALTIVVVEFSAQIVVQLVQLLDQLNSKALSCSGCRAPKGGSCCGCCP